jgi:hypothetical protein
MQVIVPPVFVCMNLLHYFAFLANPVSIYI